MPALRKLMSVNPAACTLKSSALLRMRPMPYSELFRLLNDSYLRLLNEPLVPEGVDGADWLYWIAPFAVLAHGGGSDPVFMYANRTAQTCFEYSWDEFIQLPSRLSAEAAQRADRQRLLDAVARQGFVTGYRGVRVARSGRRFWIEDGTLWQLHDERGDYRGQAAMIPSWRNL